MNISLVGGLMQKMTNIPLGNKEHSSENLSVGGIKQGDKSRTQSSENNDFSVALEQASTQVNESNRAKNVNVEVTSVKESSATAIDIGKVESEASVDGEAIEVSHVLAQINWANELDASDSFNISGDILPSKDNEKTIEHSRLDDYLLSVSDEASKLALSVPGEIVSPEAVNAEEQSLEGSQATPVINLETLVIDSDAQAIDAYAQGIEADNQLNVPKTQLPLDKNLIDKLMQESGLSEVELTLLPPENLIQLIATVTNPDRPVDLVGAQSEESRESHNLGQTPPLSMSPLFEAQATDKTSEIKDAGKLAQSQQGVGLDVLTSMKSHTQQDKDKQFSHILGENSQVDEAAKQQGSTKLPVEANAKAEQLLKGAELSVQLNPLKANVELSSTQSDTTSTPGLDIKTLPGMQIGATPQSKPEVPQFQLVLRQNNDTQSQMQEMIQRFAPVMKQQLVTMVSQGIQHAEIRLDPPELGSLMVRIQVQGDQTQVQFHVVQHQTRDLVEQALPRLREMLAEQGLELTDSQVSQRDSGKDQGEAEHSGHSQEAYDPELDEISADESLLGSNQASSYRSGIDYYA
ncbi:flagellar hook-length control protein FliK [Shewanella violacea DSS12]|uniref:Flagellar hook-length control protein FliK n=2 Tax=Shewanella violacea TaxID=60217 RepID=D4ZIA9_SHEVD|nr:flagellar hook-length control protein FliK [Shewanella violacea DSS12]